MKELIFRHQFDAHQLVHDYPAEVYDLNKGLLFDLVGDPAIAHHGTITISRWREMALPEQLEPEQRKTVVECRDGFFTYEEPPTGRVDWHLNFADSHLFCAYGGSLFAQDEMQVAEHPALASIREAMLEEDNEPLTVEDGLATPVLIMGVQRRCAIATEPNTAEGRPFGLYGNNFALADEDAVIRAAGILDPPTISNILAVEAPAGGQGEYGAEEIREILATAYTGFRAAVAESVREQGEGVKTAVHTGYWGCGAYGGNRTLMPLLQLIAANCAGLDRLIFHTGGDNMGFSAAQAMLDEILPNDTSAELNKVIEKLEQQRFPWGVSDGN